MTALTTALAVLLGLVSSSTRRVARGARDAGASALEFAIIAAIAVVLASIIGGVLFTIVNDKSGDLEDCANRPVGQACTTP